MVLAHWEAQSYYKENYTDLYDFCFRLNYICRNAQPGSKKTAERLESIWQACEKVMNVLQRGVEGNDDKLVVRSEFAGPAFQYSHGLSVFFPWSEPVASPMWDDQYAQYKMNKKTAWRDFLQEYFADTMRQPHLAERDSLDIRVEKPNLDAELLNLLQQIATRTFNTDGQLAKGGPEDRTDEGTVKAGPHDPTGDDCGCPSFKNHPHFTRARGGKNAEEKLPVSPNFFAALK